jgi:hypothetical protein
MRWVSDEFDLAAAAAYEAIGSPELLISEGWSIYRQMLYVLEEW